MKSKLLFLIFILAGVCWALIVIMVGVQHGFVLPPYLPSPWANLFVGILGGFMVAALGLRVYASASQKELIRRLRENPRRYIATSESYALDPCQTACRESYIVTDQRAR